jgi:hypothetical protein
MNKFYKYQLSSYSKLQLIIKSFVKIEIDHNFLLDLYRLIYMNNIGYCILVLRKIIKDISAISSKIKHLKDYLLNSNLINNLLKKFSLFYIIKSVNCLKSLLIQLRHKLKFITHPLKIINVPKRLEHISVLKSPHVFKKAQDHYEIRKYKKIIDLPIVIQNSKCNHISSLIEQTTRLNSSYQITFRRRNISMINNEINKT